jgi:beta-galactosidase
MKTCATGTDRAGWWRRTPRYPGYEWTWAYGWRWGNRGAVSSAPVEKPHRSSWRPILETEFDLAYTPLMEMDHGKGRITLCTLDLEDHRRFRPRRPQTRPSGPRTRAHRAAVAQGRQGRLPGRRGGGEDAGRPRACVYRKADRIDSSAGLIIIGTGGARRRRPCATTPPGGGRLLFLRARRAGGRSASAWTAHGLLGSLNPPSWPEARGPAAPPTCAGAPRRAPG